MTSTAADARLSVADRAPTPQAHLVNGSSTLPQALRARAGNVQSPAGAFAPIGSSGSPTELLTHLGPVSNDAVTLECRQGIGANDPLRTGAHRKTLTVGVSTTTP